VSGTERMDRKLATDMPLRCATTFSMNSAAPTPPMASTASPTAWMAADPRLAIPPVTPSAKPLSRCGYKPSALASDAE
jgi:hypothetical protein